MLLDTVQSPQEKLQYLRLQVAAILQQQQAPSKQMACLAGLLLSCRPAMHKAPLFVKGMYAMVNRAAQWSQQQSLSEITMQDLTCLLNWQSASVARSGHWVSGSPAMLLRWPMHPAAWMTPDGPWVWASTSKKCTQCMRSAPRSGKSEQCGWHQNPWHTATQHRAEELDYSGSVTARRPLPT